MKLTILLLCLGLTACAGKYAVKPGAAKPYVVLAGVELIGIEHNGTWVWRKAPEAVVTELTNYSADLLKKLQTAQLENAELRKAVEATKTKPEPAKP